MSRAVATAAPAAARLASWATALDAADVPPEVLAAARGQVLDTLGCGLAALGVGEATSGAAVAEPATSPGGATALGVAHPVGAGAAGLANGMLCHGLDFDSTHPASLCHIGAVVVPAALAVAEATGAGGLELLAAVVAGTEAVSRIGMAAPEGFHRRGFHPTGVCGVFGATVAACTLRGLDAETTARALGLAGSMASGLMEFLGDGAPTKPLHAGWAAQAGVQAAGLAAAGAIGPASVFEGRFGLYATHVDSGFDLDAQLADLGARWETLEVAIKRYPTCHFIAAPVDAAAEAAAGLKPQDIDRIVVRVPDVAVPIVLEPVEQKLTPAGAYDAKFSLPWCVAARLVHGRLDVPSFTGEALEDGRVLELARRVEHAPWDGEPTAFGGAAEVTAAGGDARRATVLVPRGAPENPFSEQALLAKFTGNARLALSDEAAAALARGILALDTAPEVESLLSPLRSAAAHAR
jgi:2-methylcitrate dehydratase PrpD